MLLNQIQIVEIHSNRFQFGVMIALECAFWYVADCIIIQFQRSQIAEEMETCVADRVQMIVAQIKFAQ